MSPGGQFPVPTTSDSMLLVFGCTPIYRPYVAEDLAVNAGFIIDTVITHAQVRGPKPIALESTPRSLFLSAAIGLNVLAISMVP